MSFCEGEVEEKGTYGGAEVGRERGRDDLLALADGVHESLDVVLLDRR